MHNQKTSISMLPLQLQQKLERHLLFVLFFLNTQLRQPCRSSSIPHYKQESCEADQCEVRNRPAQSIRKACPVFRSLTSDEDVAADKVRTVPKPYLPSHTNGKVLAASKIVT